MISHEIYDEWGWFLDLEANNYDNQTIKQYNKFKVVEEKMPRILYTIPEEIDLENNNHKDDKDDKYDKDDKIMFNFYYKNIITTLSFTIIITVLLYFI